MKQRQRLSVQFSRSVMCDSATPWTAVCQASLSITNSWSLFKLMRKRERERDFTKRKKEV